MKLFRFGTVGHERPGFIDEGGIARDASAIVEDYGEASFQTGALDVLREHMSRAHTLPVVELNEVRLGSPVMRPSKIIAVGLNYRDHATETGASLPPEPKIFMKATTSLCGVRDNLILPRGSLHTDYEVELAVVIGKRASYVAVKEALEFVAGYTICNDYSEREYQKNRGGQFVKGKSADTFCPLGPVLVTGDELDPRDLRLWCSVNGEMRQDSRTSEMVFDVPTIVANLSQYMTLLPGDVITTGTPSGVGMGRTPPVFLRAGDVVEYGVEKIGEARQKVCEYLPSVGD